MPRRNVAYDEELARLLGECERVVTHEQLKAVGVPPSTITWRIRRNGPWQRALPGVVIAHRGTPTVRERLLAAVRYGGDGTVITGFPALREYGIRSATQPGQVHILIEHKRQRTSHFFVTVERTERMPDVRIVNKLPLADTPRAVIDGCRRSKDLDAIRAVVAEVVQRRRCTPVELYQEVQSAARQRTALTREALSEIAAGIRSVAEAKAREVLRRAGIPPPEWNVELFGSDGEFIGSPDAYWPDVGVAIEIDSMAFHLSPGDYKRTQRRQRAFAIHGVLLLPVAPADVDADPRAFAAEAEALRAQGARRPHPAVVVRRRTASSG